jgi:hypothetical protein
MASFRVQELGSVGKMTYQDNSNQDHSGFTLGGNWKTASVAEGFW